MYRRNLIILTASWVNFFVFVSAFCPESFVRQANKAFEQKSDRFWEFDDQSNTWVELKLPYDLVSCAGEECSVVVSLNPRNPAKKAEPSSEKQAVIERVEGGSVDFLPLRRGISLTKISDSSVFVTGESGSIYQRFWNGVQWVISAHDLPVSAGNAVSVLFVNQSLLALSETGDLYQMQVGENSLPVWVEVIYTPNDNTAQEREHNSGMGLKSAVVSHDGMRLYFCTKNGSLLELADLTSPRWVNHGRPSGADVAKIADAATIRPEAIFTISSTGELYEYDSLSKPSWKKHIWGERTTEAASLLATTGCSVAGLAGAHSMSLFLLTKGGHLVERRLYQRKWKWKFHGSPIGNHLTSITPVTQDESNENTYSMFFTTATGSIFEYQMPKHPGNFQETGIQERWVNHMHPQNAKAASGVAGLHLQFKRMLFLLDDGRLGELHLSGLGGEMLGPTNLVSARRKASNKYLWSILDAPESEGWNAEYCSEERGPSNCITGTKNEPNEENAGLVSRRRKWAQAQQSYMPPSMLGGDPVKSFQESYSFPINWLKSNFRLRVLQEGRSFFFITNDGLSFECVNVDNVWLWLRHHHSMAIEGALGNYNGSLYLVDMEGSLFIRERSNDELAWVNCTAMRRGRPVMSGPPWNYMQGKEQIITPRDSLFFVSQKGRLLQFTVSMRNFKWKDCQHPPNAKIACIVDQEIFRHNIVFVIGRNGRLYQYNKVTELWHGHHQSQHLALSRFPGTAMKPSLHSLTGSIFMFSEDGRLVEYHWNALDGWNWVEHGMPDKSVTLVGAPGPCFDGNQLFVIGSDGKVYLRYMDQMTWKWKNYGFPLESERQENDVKEGVCHDHSLKIGEENQNDFDSLCNLKVAPTRPIPFSNDSVIFELRDGRLAEMQRRGVKDTDWAWSSTIGTPTSLCTQNYWMALAS